MRLSVVLLFLSFTAFPQPKRAPKGGDRVTMTGCIDQRGERYILTEDERLNKRAVLRGRAFSDDNFARYVGHRVTVQGSSSPEGEERIISVDRLDDVAETCAPASK